MDAKGKGKLQMIVGESSNSNEMLPIIATDHEIVSFVSSEMLPIVATDHEEDHVADNALPEEDLVADNVLPGVDNALPEDPDLVLALVDLDIGLVQDDLVVDNALPEVGAHNLRNVRGRGRPRRRPFSKTLSPRSQAQVNEAKAKVAALNKIQKEKEARLNKPNNIGLKKAQKPSFSIV